MVRDDSSNLKSSFESVRDGSDNLKREHAPDGMKALKIIKKRSASCASLKDL